MNKQTFNNQDINSYLLGSLPETQTEQFDELSFTDNNFIDALNSAEKELVDAYIHGELAGTALERFQSYYLASPLRRQKVTFARAFQDFAKKSDAAQAAPQSLETPAIIEAEPKRSLKGFFSGLNIFTTSRPVFQWGLACTALAFLFFGIWTFMQNSRLQNQIYEAQMRQQEFERRESELQRREKELQSEVANQRETNAGKEAELARVREELARLEKAQEQNRKQLADQEQERRRLNEAERAAGKPAASPHQVSIVTLILSPSLRGSGGGQMPTLSIPARSADLQTAVQLELEPNDYNSYKVVLQSQTDNRILWQSGRLKADLKGENKFLNLRFPAKLLKSQSYSLVVSGINATGAAEIISNYPFRAVLK